MSVNKECIHRNASSLSMYILHGNISVIVILVLGVKIETNKGCMHQKSLLLKMSFAAMANGTHIGKCKEVLCFV